MDRANGNRPPTLASFSCAPAARRDHGLWTGWLLRRQPAAAADRRGDRGRSGRAAPDSVGLVRAGMAPDYPKIKSVSRVYEKMAKLPAFRYLGNVEVGRDVGQDQLTAHYHAALYAIDPLTDRRLAIPGEELHGRLPGRPVRRLAHRPSRLPRRGVRPLSRRAVVVGNGNVALDVARTFALRPDEFPQTGFADDALEALKQSASKLPSPTLSCASTRSSRTPTASSIHPRRPSTSKAVRSSRATRQTPLRGGMWRPLPIPNDRGRVTHRESGAPWPGLYAAGGSSGGRQG